MPFSRFLRNCPHVLSVPRLKLPSSAVRVFLPPCMLQHAVWFPCLLFFPRMVSALLPYQATYSLRPTSTFFFSTALSTPGLRSLLFLEFLLNMLLVLLNFAFNLYMLFFITQWNLGLLGAQGQYLEVLHIPRVKCPRSVQTVSQQ